MLNRRNVSILYNHIYLDYKFKFLNNKSHCELFHYDPWLLTTLMGHFSKIFCVNTAQV